MGNYNDHLMEQLADLGDGFYSYVDTFGEAVDLFVDNLTPTLTVVAEEAKIQVVFDDERRRPLPADRLREPGPRRRPVQRRHRRRRRARRRAPGQRRLRGGAGRPGVRRGAVAAGEVRLRWRSAETGEADRGAPAADDRRGRPVAEPAPRRPRRPHRRGAARQRRGDRAWRDPGRSLLAEADELARSGVDGAAEIVELISTAIHAEDPARPSPS